MRRWALISTSVLLTLALMGWLASLGIGQRRRTVWGGAGAAVAFLISAGWLVALTAANVAAEPFNARHITDLALRWPESVFVITAKEGMWFHSCLLCVLLLTSEPMTGQRWRGRWFTAIVMSGGLLLSVGVVWEFVFSVPAVRTSAAPLISDQFAFFADESIGVSFICLIWPMAAGGLLGRFSVLGKLKHSELGRFGGWAGVVVVGWLGLAVVGSLLGVIVGGVLGVFFGLWVLWRLPAMNLKTYVVRCLRLVAICVIVSAVGAIAGGRKMEFQSHWRRLQEMLVQEASSVAQRGKSPKSDFRMRADGLILSGDNPAEPGFSRLQRSKVMMLCLRIVPRAGLLGFGPGSWSVVYPHFTDDPLLRTYYPQMQFAHQDFLQALVEWGVVGTMVWAYLFIGAFRRGFYRLRRYRAKGGQIGEKEGMLVGAMGGLVGVLACAWWYFPLQVPAIQLIVVILLGILWSAGDRHAWSSAETMQEVVPKSEPT